MQANAQGYEPSFRKTLGYLNENSSTLFDVLRGGYVNPYEYCMFRSCVLIYGSVNSLEMLGNTRWPNRRTQVRCSYKEETNIQKAYKTNYTKFQKNQDKQ